MGRAIKRGVGRGLGVLVASLAILAASAALAAAATPPTTTPTPVSTPTPKPTPKPAKGAVNLYVLDAFFVARQPVTIPNRSLKIGGVVRPYVPGQWVRVRAFLAGRLIKSSRLRIQRSRNGTYGHFTQTLSSPGVGDVTVRVTHVDTSTLSGFSGRRSFAVLNENVGFGSIGRFVELLQQRLAALHFYIPQSGVYDAGTGWALDAYHRLLHWGTYQTLDHATITWLLNGWGDFKVRYPSHGKHAEGNLSLQLLALLNGSQVYRIYPISSGKPSTPTILGSFHVYSKVPSYLPDGMYYSNFFITGYAIHGFNPAPDYPASHGCMRVPIADAQSIYGWLDIGNGVDVYP